jgi:branched-chain amino acid transport system permease protein
MTTPNRTIKKLAEITDATLFERLATAVLRSCKPSLYENLSHPGVNPDGKTVKAPLDGIGWVRDAGSDIIVLAALIMGGLMLLVNRTRLGRAMRATAQSPEVASLMGVNVNHVISMTFILGSCLGAVAGVMVSANYGQAHAYMGFLLGLKAFSAAVLGGIGNLAGAVIGGLLLGIIESLGAGYIGDLTGGFLGSQYQDVFAFMVLILVLVFRPSGLMGERVAERP